MIEGIKLKNGHVLWHVIASGAAGFDGKFWFWEWVLVWLGLIEPKLFTICLRTLSLKPRPYPISNFSWVRVWTWMPFFRSSCVRLLINGGVLNKIGLWNPGIDHWIQKIAPHINFAEVDIVVSIYGNQEELVEQAKKLNNFNIVAIEVNDSCPNTGHGIPQYMSVVNSVKAVATVSRHPVIVKVSVMQDYLSIANELRGIACAVSLNSVPWKIVFRDAKSPMEDIGPAGSGGGGVSGRPAQIYNWRAARELAEAGSIPVIAPSIMSYDDLRVVEQLGAGAFSYGAIHLPDKGILKFWLTLFKNPCKPTKIVKEYEASREYLRRIIR